MLGLGKLLIVLAVITISFKIAVGYGLRDFDFAWFRFLDNYGHDAGWNLRFSFAAVGIGMMLVSKWKRQ